MNLEQRITAFQRLGAIIVNDITQRHNSSINEAIESAQISNPWFVRPNVEKSLLSIAEHWLTAETLAGWISAYNQRGLIPVQPKNIGVIMAGNIPLVGFHDLLCVLMSGNRFVGKLSSKDSVLMRTIVDMLVQIEPAFADLISITDGHLKNFDAVIATGSDSSSKYFDFYFRGVPSIIRKHRNSVAVLTGSETERDYKLLADDIFSYFGLGCRSVSKLFVPEDFNLIPLLDSFSCYSSLINHNKYANNYEYSRAMYAMNQIKHLDTGFLLVTESEQMESPVGVLYYQKYSALSDVERMLEINAERIQCVVGSSGIIKHEITFGTAQQPSIDDYADGVDTIEFLINL